MRGPQTVRAWSARACDLRAGATAKRCFDRSRRSICEMARVDAVESTFHPRPSDPHIIYAGQSWRVRDRHILWGCVSVLHVVFAHISVAILALGWFLGRFPMWKDGDDTVSSSVAVLQPYTKVFVDANVDVYGTTDFKAGMNIEQL
eukprot:1258953-Lingulodinium_polyedra.AAC.1